MQNFHTIFLIALLVFPVLSLAQEEIELEKSGTLSSSVSAGFSNQKVPKPWGGDVLGNEQAPISGSVSRATNNEWIMRVFNNSEDKYRVTLEVAQYGRAGRKIKGDHFSYSLKPGETVERNIRGTNGTESADLKLKSWKNLSKKAETEVTGEVK
ncbi:MAG: hypothetical protein R3A13_10200 [Bdellovibrionota bacterium]